MNRQSVIARSRKYQELQARFVELCGALINLLPAGNQVGIEILTGDSVSRGLTVLGHRATMSFGYAELNGVILGKIDIYMHGLGSQFNLIKTIYFDDLRNYGVDNVDAPRSNSFGSDADIMNHLTVEILGAYIGE